MTLNRRKQAILAAIIKTHILTGEPVGSKTLCNMFDFGLSSATLRNEMSELCELGFLEQPHTSAGRIPSSLGYRIYVDNILPELTVSAENKAAIDGAFETLSPDPEYLPGEATKMLSDLTGLTAINATVVSPNTTVRRAEVGSLGRRMIMLLVVTSDGNTKKRICRTATEISPKTLAVFEKLLADKIDGQRLSGITPAYIQTVISSAGADAFSVISLMSAIYGLITDIMNTKINIAGESNLFKNLKNDAAAGRLLEYMTHSESVIPILENGKGTVNVLFGDETDIAALKPSCLIVTSYGTGDTKSGRIGVIGSTRMAYDNIIPSIEYFAHRLGNAMTEALQDMEV